MYGWAPSSMGPTLASTLPWVRTTPLGSPVVPEVKRICSGVSCDRPETAPISAAGRWSSQSSKASVGKSAGEARWVRSAGTWARVRRQLGQQERVADGEFGVDVRGHARGKIGGSGGVERNGQHPAQQAAVEGGDPLGAVFSPQQYAVALADALRGQERGKTAGEARQIAIRRDVAPVAPISAPRQSRGRSGESRRSMWRGGRA